MTAGSRRTGTGVWYYVITIASAGLLASVPFFHAASILRQRRVWKLGGAYAAATVLGALLIETAPVDATGSPTGWMGNLAGFLMLGIIVAACVQQRSLRKQVYDGRQVTPLSTASNHAIAAVELARAKRRDARQLAERDPLMARELRIGRPDLPRNYDDGGLVDLNSAPAQVIAGQCQIPLAVAARLTDTRSDLGRFSSVSEALVYANVDADLSEVIRDRAIVLPAGGTPQPGRWSGHN